MCVTVGSFNAMRKKNVMCKQRGTLKQQAYYNVFLLLFSTCCTKRCFEKANSSEFVTGCICVLCDFLIELIYIATGMHKSVWSSFLCTIEVTLLWLAGLL